MTTKAKLSRLTDQFPFHVAQKEKKYFRLERIGLFGSDMKNLLVQVIIITQNIFSKADDLNRPEKKH